VQESDATVKVRRRGAPEIEGVLPLDSGQWFESVWVDLSSHRYDAVCQGGDGEAGKVAAAIDHSDIRGLEPHFIGPPESASDNGRGLVPPLWEARIFSGASARLSNEIS
jgi:hypothetical protein